MNKKRFTLFSAITVLFLSACSTQLSKQTPTEESAQEQIEIHKITPPSEMINRQKGEKTLKLVRVMEGGACKNDRQGVTGKFMLYAYPKDVERINKQQGATAFKKIEQMINDFSSVALQRAVNHSEFSVFAVIPDEATHKKTVQQIIQNFKKNIAIQIAEFEKETTLTIDIEASEESFQLYLDGCNLASIDKK